MRLTPAMLAALAELAAADGVTLETLIPSLTHQALTHHLRKAPKTKPASPKRAQRGDLTWDGQLATYRSIFD